MRNNMFNAQSLTFRHSYHFTFQLFFRNCLGRLSWIWRSMTSTELTSLRVFWGNYDILILYFIILFASQQNISINHRMIVNYLTLLQSLEFCCCHVFYYDNYYFCFLISQSVLWYLIHNEIWVIFLIITCIFDMMTNTH